MKSIFVHSQDSTGCTLYRAVLPVRHCADELLLEHGIKLELRTHILHSEQPDAFMVHRILNADAVIQLAAKKHRGMRLVHDSDDLMEFIPQWSPVRYSPADLELYQALQVIADEKTCSTGVLHDELQGARVLPNLIDLQMFEGKKPVPPPGRAIQVLWFGSGTHRADLELVEPAVIQCLEKYPGKVKFTFWGISPFGQLANHIGTGVQFVDMVPLAEFYPRLTAYQPDIVLCPLVHHRFNDAKSNIKWLEGAMAGAACIVSPSAAFADVEDGVTGVEASDSDWFGKLALLIENVQGRRTIARQGREFVAEEFSWQKSGMREQWLRMFTEQVEEDERPDDPARDI